MKHLTVFHPVGIFQASLCLFRISQKIFYGHIFPCIICSRNGHILCFFKEMSECNRIKELCPFVPGNGNLPSGCHVVCSCHGHFYFLRIIVRCVIRIEDSIIGAYSQCNRLISILPLPDPRRIAVRIRQCDSGKSTAVCRSKTDGRIAYRICLIDRKRSCF